MEILNNLDLDQNQIFNLVLEKLPAAPSGADEGRIYYNETDDIIYYRNSIEWVPLTKSVLSVNGGTGSSIGGTTTNPIVNVNTDGITVEINGANQIQIKDGGVTNTKLGSLAISTDKIQDGAITFSKFQGIPTMTVLGRTVAGTGEASAINIINDMSTATATTLATSGSIKAYVDGAVASIGSLIGGFDASSGTVLPGDAQTKKGDYWYVTVAGTIQSQIFNVGDVIVANKSAPTTTNPNHYVFLESNRDQATTTTLGLVKLASSTEVLNGTGTGVVTVETLILRTATESRTGLAQKASQAEFDAGLNDTKFVTSKQVKDALGTVIAHTALVGGALSVSIPNPYATKNITASLWRVSNNKMVLSDIEATDAFVTVSFTKVHPAGTFRLVFSNK